MVKASDTRRRQGGRKRRSAPSYEPLYNEEYSGGGVVVARVCEDSKQSVLALFFDQGRR